MAVIEKLPIISIISIISLPLPLLHSFPPPLPIYFLLSTLPLEVGPPESS